MYLPSDWKKLFQTTNIPDSWLPWLANADSMTRALEEASGVECQVRVLHEGWGVPWPDECDDVGAIPCGCPLWIREVILITRKPVVFARSVFPKEFIEHFPKVMLLGSRPLGKTIFADGEHKFQRGDIEVAEITHGDLLWQQIPPEFRAKKHWARRSLFHSSASPFLLSEVFLPYVTTL